MDQGELVIGDLVQWTDPDNADYEGKYRVADIIPAELNEDNEIQYMLLDDTGQPSFVNASDLH